MPEALPEMSTDYATALLKDFDEELAVGKLDDVIRDADRDGDCRINYEEFTGTWR